MSLRFYFRFFGKFALLIAGCGIGITTAPIKSIGETKGAPESFLPQAVTAESFTELKNFSPFRRSVDLSDSLVLTGMATIEGQVYATIFDSKSIVSHVVSEQANKNGWRLVGVRGNDFDLESLTAKIQVDGGDVVSIRYAKVEIKGQRSGGGTAEKSGTGGGSLSQEQIDAARQAARDPARGFSGDGYRGPPPPEMMAKLNKITPQQREELARRVMQMRNNGVDSGERRRIYSEALDRAARGR